jgi:molybdopterin converting factor small subunit
MIEVRLFGNLRRYAAGSTVDHETLVHLPVDDGETVGRVLAQMGIELTEIGNMFLNGRLLPRSRYPILLGYPLTAESPLSPDGYLDTAVKAGDRLGIFPRNMGCVVV